MIERQPDEKYQDRIKRAVDSYVQDHPEEELAKMRSEGVLDERIYRILKETSRDSKTGLLRDVLLPYFLETQIEATRDNDYQFAVAIFDIDDFKQINTELGHVAADDILRQVATIISHRVRPHDDVVRLTDDEQEQVIRWGGEEFLVILTGVTSEQALNVAERIRLAIAGELANLRPSGQPVTISGGVVGYDHTKYSDQRAVIEAADQLMMAAKKSGKNKVIGQTE